MKNKASDTALKLFDKLKAFHNNKDFVLGVMCNAPHDDDMKTIIDFMDYGDEVTVENIILLSLELGNERETK